MPAPRPQTRNTRIDHAHEDPTAISAMYATDSDDTRARAAEKGERGWYRESEKQAQAELDLKKQRDGDKKDKPPLLGEGSNIRMGYRGDKFKKESTRR